MDSMNFAGLALASTTDVVLGSNDTTGLASVAKKNSEDKKLYGRGHFNLLSVGEEEALKNGVSNKYL